MKKFLKKLIEEMIIVSFVGTLGFLIFKEFGYLVKIKDIIIQEKSEASEVKTDFIMKNHIVKKINIDK